MTSYQIADGHNNAAGLAALTPQPASDGPENPRLNHAGSGAAYADGMLFTIWRYSSLTETDYASLLTQMGLAAAQSNDVTVKTNAGGNRATWTNYNATIVKPLKLRYRRGFYKDVEFLVKQLVAL